MLEVWGSEKDRRQADFGGNKDRLVNLKEIYDRVGIDQQDNETRCQSLSDQQWTGSLFQGQCFKKREVKGDWTRGLELKMINKQNLAE